MRRKYKIKSSNSTADKVYYAPLEDKFKKDYTIEVKDNSGVANYNIVFKANAKFVTI